MRGHKAGSRKENRSLFSGGSVAIEEIRLLFLCKIHKEKQPEERRDGYDVLRIKRVS